MHDYRLIVNNDFYNIFQIEPPVERADVLAAVDKLADTHVDALALELPFVLGGSSVSPEILRHYLAPDADPCQRNIAEFHAREGDPYTILLERCREKGLAFFASLRPNDTHYKDQPFSPFIDQFYYDHLHDRIGPPEGRANTEYDYRKSAVREQYLALVRRAVTEYPVDGLEINFTRNCRFFPPPHTEECAPVLTQFMADVRAILDEAGEARGTRLGLSAMVPYSLHGCRREGLDIPLWARLGLIDMLILTSPFLARFGHEIADAKRKCPGVRVYAGCDRNLEWGPGGGRVVPMQTYRAMAADAYAQGADGIHLFNVMAWTMNAARMPACVRRHGGQGETGEAPLDYDIHLARELGDPETLRYLDKLYLLATAPESEDNPYAGLPVRVPAGGEATLRLSIGDEIARADEEGRIDRILLQTVSPDCNDHGNYTLKLNTVDLARQYAYTPWHETPEETLLFPEPARQLEKPDPATVRRHAVRAVDLHAGTNYVTIKSYGEAMTISHLELGIFYRAPSA